MGELDGERLSGAVDSICEEVLWLAGQIDSVNEKFRAQTRQAVKPV